MTGCRINKFGVFTISWSFVINYTLLHSKISLHYFKAFRTKFDAVCINSFYLLSCDSADMQPYEDDTMHIKLLKHSLTQLLLKWTEINVTSFIWNIRSKCFSDFWLMLVVNVLRISKYCIWIVLNYVMLCMPRNKNDSLSFLFDIISCLIEAHVLIPSD